MYRLIGCHAGWRTANKYNRDVLTVETTEADTPLGPGLVTTINGELHDRDGSKMVDATA